MSNEITMPKLSDTMEEGKIIRWLKHPGDQVHHGDALAEVETDKADMVMESFDDGILEELRLKEGESAPVGATIAVLRGTGEKATKTAPEAMAEVSDEAEDLAEVTSGGTSKEAEAEAAVTTRAPERVTPLRPARRRKSNGGAQTVDTRAEQSSAPPAPERDSAIEDTNADENGAAFPMSREFHPALSAHPSATPTAIVAPPALTEAPKTADANLPKPHDGKLRASPLARRAAEEAGIDLAQVHGTGPEGRVTKRDIDNFIREQQLFRFRRLVAPREGLPGTREELSKMRRTIAQRMAQSKREIPHFYVTVEVDMEEVGQA